MMNRFLLTGVMLTSWILFAADGPLMPTFSSEKNGDRDIQVKFRMTRFRPKHAKTDVNEMERPYFEFGRKEVGVRRIDGKDTDGKDHLLYIESCGRPVLQMGFRGVTDCKPGEPFEGREDMPAELLIDLQKKTITYLLTYWLPDAKTAVFRYVAEVKRGHVVVSWDLGISLEQLKQYGDSMKFGLFFQSGVRPERPFLLNGAPLRMNSREKLLSDRVPARVYAGKGAVLTYSPANPEESIKIRFPQSFVSVTERQKRTLFRSGGYALMFRINPVKPQVTGRIIIDFVKTDPDDRELEGGMSESVDARCMDEDRMAVPMSVLRNHMPNPGFEQGLRYWSLLPGGEKSNESGLLAYEVNSDNAEFAEGMQCLKIRGSGTPHSPLRSFPIAVEPGMEYTLSFFVKSDDPEGTIRMRVLSLASEKKIPTMPALRPGTKWVRYFFRFRAPGTAIALQLEGNSKKNLWVDSIQLERGNKMSPYVSLPIEGSLNLTQKPGCKPVCSFKLNGRLNQAVDLDFKLKNLYGTTIWGKIYPAIAGRTVPLSFDELNLKSGLYLLEVNFLGTGIPMYREYYRFYLSRHAQAGCPLSGFLVNPFCRTRHTGVRKQFFLDRIGFTEISSAEKNAVPSSEWRTDSRPEAGFQPDKDGPVKLLNPPDVLAPSLIGTSGEWTNGRPTYAFSRAEYRQAAFLARAVLDGLRYRRRVPRMDLNLDLFFGDVHAVLAAVAPIDTITTLFRNPEFFKEVRKGKVCGYAFREKDGSGILALWAESDGIDSLRENAPVLRFRSSACKLRYMDVQGMEKQLTALRDGPELNLTMFPVFLMGDSVEHLVNYLEDATVLEDQL